MASNELSLAVDIELPQLPSTYVQDDDVFDDIAKGADFLGRLQLFTKGKAIDKGHIRPGHYGIPEGDDEITDLGDSIDVLVLERRTKALDMSDTDAIITNYDRESAEFRRIEAMSMERDSGCMYGPSFLVIERTTGRFLEFFCGTKSTRSEAKKIYPFLPLSQAQIDARKLTGQEPHGPIPMTLKSRHVEKGKWSWHVPVVVKGSVPFTNVPSGKRIIDEVTKFRNPVDASPEVVEEPATKSKRAR